MFLTVYQNNYWSKIPLRTVLRMNLSLCYQNIIYSPLFSYGRYKMLLKTALSNALYVKHLTYFLELAAAEYTTETAEGLKIRGGDCKRRYLIIHGTVFTSKSAKIEGGRGQMYP